MVAAATLAADQQQSKEATMQDPRMMAMMGGNFGRGGCCNLPKGNNVITGTGGGGLVRITPETPFNFNIVSGGTTETIVLAKYVDTTMWVSGVLIVRIHSYSGDATDLYVKVQNASYAEEDPSTYYFDSGTNLASVQVDAGTTGTISVDDFSTPPAAQVRVVLEASNPSSSGAATCTIGVDLVGRPC